MNATTVTNMHARAASRAFADFVEQGCPPNLVAAWGRVDIGGPDFKWTGTSIAKIVGAPDGVILVTAKRGAFIVVCQMVGPDGIVRNVRAAPIAHDRFHISYDGAGLCEVSISFIVIASREDLS